MTPPSPPLSADDEQTLAEAAAAWIVQLDDDDPQQRAAARRDYEAWKRADPRHAAMAADMERFVARARGLAEASARGGPSAARATLDALLQADPAKPSGKTPSRGRGRGPLLALALTLGLAGALAFQPEAQSRWLADLSTAPGASRQQTLDDGSRLLLGGASAVNVRMDAHRRELELLRGELLVEVAPDARRPFEVSTPQGRIRALGTRFLVRREADATLLTMIESRTQVLPAGQAGTGGLTVQAGQQARLSDQGARLLPSPVDPALVEEAFTQRRLVVHDRPLPEVLDELARQHRGLLRYEREALQPMRVTAVLPLDEPERALQLLAARFPQLRVRALTPWILSVDTRH
ncbi:FecR domain-containing protein [Pelomonas sp. CA6]|uniref:FecR family protein n=1 Tax=Pelomonas sp. CA6 TaxID=2907999 RepID=UPI001F4C241B|nr:FecR domain-containing protein [Pelomonas sp. CA6]MCH7343809.1 FecR domain-containing protein [Pelomonas sp. CA6]